MNQAHLGHVSGSKMRGLYTGIVSKCESGDYYIKNQLVNHNTPIRLYKFCREFF